MRQLNPRSWSLAAKLAFTITAVAAGVGFTTGAVIVAQDWKRFHEELEDHALLMARSVAVAAPDAVLRDDYWSLYKSLKTMAFRISSEARNSRVTASTVLDAEGRVLAHLDPQVYQLDLPLTPEMSYSRILTGMVLDAKGRVLAHLDPSSHPLGLPFAPKEAEEQRLLESALRARTSFVIEGSTAGEGFLEGVVPVHSGGKLLGVVRVRLSTAELNSHIIKVALIVLALTLGLIALGSLLGALISKRMVRPLAELAQGMESVGRGDPVNIAPLAANDKDEIGRLVNAFKRMTAELEEKKRLEEEISVSEKLVALGRIAAGVAHEVNNPVAGMLNCIDTLKKHPDEPKLLERYLPLLDKGLGRIRDITGDLLVELRIDDSADESSDTDCLEDLKGLVDAGIGSRHVELVWDSRLERQVRVNCQRIQQVLLNLLKNAVEALSDRGTVTFRSFHDGKWVVLEVEDDGPGIPLELRSQVFDPFFTTHPNGTGLGLWIVYRLVQSMQGFVDFESETGCGTRFRVRLPFKQVYGEEHEENAA
jgi:signal transduction histidine kinase